MEEQELEKRVLEALRKDNRSRSRTPKRGLRQAFVLHNQCWIEFLNDYATGELAKCEKITHHWQRLDGTPGHDDEVDLTQMTAYLEKWQSENFIVSADLESGNRITGYRFCSEKELMLSLAEWMYQNLSGISRGAAKEILYEGKIDRRIINAFLGLVRVCSWGYDYGERDDSYLPVMARYLHLFWEYLKEAKDGREADAKLGIFRVAVCPYQVRGMGAPCGKVFVVKTGQRACQEHRVKWQSVRSQRTRRSNVKMYKNT